MDFKQELVKLLAKDVKLKKEELASLMAVPPDPKLGDYAFPCFKLGKNPLDEAKKLKSNLSSKTKKLPSFLSKIETAGPYLNFFINQTVLAEETLTKISKEKKKYGQSKNNSSNDINNNQLNKNKKNNNVVIEYCGPNTNKPLHLGHLRNMALGNAICRILAFQGNKVHPVNIVNDRGIHICQSMLAYQKWGRNRQPNKKGDHFVGDYYVLFAQKVKEDESLKDQAQELLLKWEQKDKETIALWEKMNKWVLDGFKETYQRFGVSFEKEYFESLYYEKGKELVLAGLKKKVFTKNEEGAVIAPLEKQGLPDKVVLREDQTSIYITQDMYLAKNRSEDFKFDKMIYVVASEQDLHFKQLFKILEMLNLPFAKNLYHLSYGLVNLPSGRMKSREGTVVDADDIMDETAALADKEIRKRYKKLSVGEIRKRAEFISLAAIKFFMLKNDPIKNMVYNPEESLSFEGETGPYVQYTHARACSILRKARQEHKLAVSAKVNFTAFNLDEELAVVKLLYGFPEVLMKVAQTYKPHHLAQYLISLSQAFNEFYHKCPVISELEQQMKARLLLVDSVRQVLENGLNLLGIIAPVEM